MADAWIEVPVSTKAGFTTTLLDVDDYLRLDGRALSLGSHGYAQMWDRKAMTLLHRWVLGLGKGRRLVADHRNFVKLDNRQRNLRVLTPSLSNMNRRIKAANAEFGVYPARGRWAAKGFWRTQTHHLGTFDGPEEAAEVVRQWQLAVRPHGEAIRPKVIAEAVTKGVTGR